MLHPIASTLLPWLGMLHAFFGYLFKGSLAAAVVSAGLSAASAAVLARRARPVAVPKPRKCRDSLDISTPPSFI